MSRGAEEGSETGGDRDALELSSLFFRRRGMLRSLAKPDEVALGSMMDAGELQPPEKRTGLGASV